jgi:hypothetical protein
MRLKDQCVSYDLAKRLKELGIKQESYFIWAKNNLIPRLSIMQLDKHELFEPHICAAFTIAELGEMLPLWWDSGKREGKDYMCRVYEKTTDKTHHAFAETEADSRAKLLIHLLENGLI